MFLEKLACLNYMFNHSNKLAFLDLITKLLNVDDLTTNGVNYGFIENHLKIIDF